MTSIITGDIINSRKVPPKLWMDGLKTYFSTIGSTPQTWEIYRGDAFQLEVANPEEALHTALRIKAYLKTLQLDARMSVGFGDKSYAAARISESNGSAFVRSGELFETLKKQKVTLALNSGNEDFDQQFNLMLRLALTFMDNWLAQPAEFVVAALDNPDFSQEEIGGLLGINQAAVSRRRKRAQFDLLLDLDIYFRTKVKTL